MIKIVDYGMGNLRSVQKAFEKLGTEAVICAKSVRSSSSDAEKLVLPGVGAFRDAIHELRRTGLDKPVRDHIAAGRPFLGICLGLQLLFDVSYEDGQWEGLGVLAGQVVRFKDQPDLKIPHMGWNTLDIAGQHKLFEGIAGRFVGLFCAQLLRRAERRIGDRRPHRTRIRLHLGCRPRKPVRHAVSPGKEPGGGVEIAAELCQFGTRSDRRQHRRTQSTQ